MNVAHGSRRRIVRRAGLAASLGLAVVTLSGCSINNSVLRFGWPTGVTPQAHRMRELWTWSVVAALAMGILVWALTFWTITFHRKRQDSPEFPRQTGYNVPLELVYTAVPFVAISILFYFTVVTQNYVEKNPANPDVTVDVTAYQWNWKFGYRQAHEFGYTNGEIPQVKSPELKEKELRMQTKEGEDLSYLVNDKIETVGSSTEIPVLVLPTDRSIQFQLASADVVHSFWVPEFLFKRDVMPNPAENHSQNVFTISKIDREGAFVGRCAEMCGTYHSMMNFEVRAVSPDKFQRYLQAREQGESNAQALSSIGQSPVAITTHPFKAERLERAASEAPTGY
ncbi:cytochrome c oxidase subunit II [Rhodococcus sp. D2-41]|uniref:cytochrome-c oxidase n=1 Tax=Speluncibacter jeojiensis TaxID=2710754 RepID=A0A9X4LXZ6_9ACTN|nr:cytochrome c oxidase subunit II [Rhodococcus sp. D2-41]MDG3011939.1 cytochrome c oxidase subunit II [Rhodococcus sp. D2-41]MDG3013390.1 cytochrome c oxidase subunit II [Corynebacteriales bacterium D3-21]